MAWNGYSAYFKNHAGYGRGILSIVLNLSILPYGSRLYFGGKKGLKKIKEANSWLYNNIIEVKRYIRIQPLNLINISCGNEKRLLDEVKLTNYVEAKSGSKTNIELIYRWLQRT